MTNNFFIFFTETIVVNQSMQQTEQYNFATKHLKFIQKLILNL